MKKAAPFKLFFLPERHARNDTGVIGRPQAGFRLVPDARVEHIREHAPRRREREHDIDAFVVQGEAPA